MSDDDKKCGEPLAFSEEDVEGRKEAGFVARRVYAAAEEGGRWKSKEMGFTRGNLGHGGKEALVAGAADQGGGELSEEVKETLKRMGQRHANESKRKEKLREKVEEAIKEVLRAADARSRTLSARSGMTGLTITDGETQAMRAMAEVMGILADEVLGKPWALEDPPEPK